MSSFLLCIVHGIVVPRRQLLHVVGASCTGLLVVPHRKCLALTVDPSLTDEDGLFVVDPRKALAGLTDPDSEPVGAYSTISAALSVAPRDATVIVRPGMYTEQVTITRPVKLLADAGAVLTWKTDRPYEHALTVSLVEGGEHDHVLISGLSINHHSRSVAQNYAVFVPVPSSAEADRVRILLKQCDITSSSGRGVGVEGGDVSLEQCRVTACQNHGIIYVGSSARGVVEKSSVEKCKLNGILLRDGASPLLRSNRLAGNAQYGIALFDCRGVLEGNDLSGNGKGGVSGECDLD